MDNVAQVRLPDGTVAMLEFLKPEHGPMGVEYLTSGWYVFGLGGGVITIAERDWLHPFQTEADANSLCDELNKYWPRPMFVVQHRTCGWHILGTAYDEETGRRALVFIEGKSQPGPYQTKEEALAARDT